MPSMDKPDPEVTRLQAIFDALRARALTAGLKDTEIEALSWRARDEAFLLSAESILEIYQRLIDEAIASRSAHERDAR